MAASLAAVGRGRDPLVYTARGPDDPAVAALGAALAAAGLAAEDANVRIGTALGRVLDRVIREGGAAAGGNLGWGYLGACEPAARDPCADRPGADDSGGGDLPRPRRGGARRTGAGAQGRADGEPGLFRLGAGRRGRKGLEHADRDRLGRHQDRGRRDGAGRARADAPAPRHAARGLCRLHRRDPGDGGGARGRDRENRSVGMRMPGWLEPASRLGRGAVRPGCWTSRSRRICRRGSGARSGWRTTRTAWPCPKRSTGRGRGRGRVRGDPRDRRGAGHRRRRPGEDGREHWGGEWGHNPLPFPDTTEILGRPCYCGRHGCMETWVSGRALRWSTSGIPAKAEGDVGGRADAGRRPALAADLGSLRRPGRARARHGGEYARSGHAGDGRGHVERRRALP